MSQLLTQVDHLEVIHDVFNDISENLVEDCERTIYKLLKNSERDETNFCKSPDYSKLSHLNILLELYKKGYSSRTENTSRLSIKPVLEKLSSILNDQRVDYVLSESCFIKEMIKILNLLFKIAFLHKSQEDFQELALFYYQNLEIIDTVGYSNTGLLSVRLKILCAVYDSISELKNEYVASDFSQVIRKFKSGNKVDECQLFADLVIHSSDEIAVQMLLVVIPMYMKCFDTTKVTIIWEDLSNSLTNQKTNVSYARMLLVMCYLFDLSQFNNKKEELFVVLEDANYWTLIQYGLVQSETLMKKQGMYLFKRALNLLESSNENLTTHPNERSNNDMHKIVMRWDCNSKSELSSIYGEIIVILEFLDEQQIHIIKPIFQMVDKLVGKILCSSGNGHMISFSWIILIYQKALMHESAQVIKWGLCSLLKLPEKVFTDNYMMEMIADLLVSSLNNTSLYYNDGLTMSKELGNFFKRVAHLDSSKMFFSLFIKKLCSLVWSPESLYFVTHALASTPKMTVWQEDELLHVRKFVSQAFRTHNKVIRAGTQCELLNSIMLLTDEKSVSLESIVILLSSFPRFESLQVGSQMWRNIVQWLRCTYSKQDAEKCLENYSENNSKSEFSDRFVALMMILFFDAYSTEADCSECFVLNKLSQILLSFDGIKSRLYCDKVLYNHYLSVICHILEENFNGEVVQRNLLKMILPSCMEILLYIHVQCKQVSSLQDYHICQLYIKTFEYVLKTLKYFQNHSGNIVKTLDSQIIKDLEVYMTQSSDMASIEIYCGMKLLKAFFSVFSDCDIIKSGFLRLYLDGAINEPLKKNESHSEKTRDLQTLWGKMNSEYLEAKWEILEKLVTMKAMVADLNDYGKENRISGEELIKFCVEGLAIGGYGVLCPVMSILGNFLFQWNNDTGIGETVDLIWELITERRKTDEFKLFVKKFVVMLFHEELMVRGGVVEGVLFKYVNLLFADSSLVVVHIFVKHIQEMGINPNTVPLLSHILAKALIFGPVQKKDERLTIQVSSVIESFGLVTVGEYNRSNEIRARAVQIILTLDRDCSSSQDFAEIMFETLLKLEVEINKNKIRYFGDSHVHRVKHRLMQVLLLLEPLLSCNKKVAEKLSTWLYNSLMSENPQPSVKYQQEWLLMRVLMKRNDLLNKFWNFFNDSVEKKAKGLCSLIAISYHLCKLIRDKRETSWMDQTIPTILPFCMDQHFEVRLYAQVTIEKLYELAKSRELKYIIDKYKMINDCVLQSIQRGCKGNAGKNCDKLKEDFYLNVFNPLEHYSLQTIYQDLPRLANIGSDEWISPKVFKLCGVDPNKIHIPMENPTRELEDIDEVKWLVKGFGQSVEEGLTEGSLEEPGNYQKKMVPLKPLAPGWEEGVSFTKSPCSNNIVKKDGLVVVASLIDRVPNLGGLVRTCEIFGASEFVIGSLKYVQDKQFTSLSVTAEKWVTVKEVKVQNLTDYILRMKENGYTVIGAEQALYSQSLSSVRFPKQSLLLLGNEKEGIPPNLLPLLDVCVEIPQVGIIRSLNVHVTGALFIWEYAKQNNFS